MILKSQQAGQQLVADHVVTRLDKLGANVATRAGSVQPDQGKAGLDAMNPLPRPSARVTSRGLWLKDLGIDSEPVKPPMGMPSLPVETK